MDAVWGDGGAWEGSTAMHTCAPPSQKPGVFEKPGFFGQSVRIRNNRLAGIPAVPTGLPAAFSTQRRGLATSATSQVGVSATGTASAQASGIGDRGTKGHPWLEATTGKIFLDIGGARGYYLAAQ